MIKDVVDILDNILNRFEENEFNNLVERCGNTSFLTIKEKEKIIDPYFLRLVKILLKNNDNKIDYLMNDVDLIKIAKNEDEVKKDLLIITSEYNNVRESFNIFEITNVVLYIIKTLSEDKDIEPYNVLKLITDGNFIDIKEESLKEKIKKMFLKNKTEKILNIHPLDVALLSILSNTKSQDVAIELIELYNK